MKVRTTLQRLVIGGFALAVATWVGIVAMAPVQAAQQGSGAHQDFPPQPGGTPFIITIPTMTTPVPPSDSPPSSGHSDQPAPKKVAHRPSAAAVAERLAVSNPVVRTLVKGKAYKIASITTWPAGHGQVVTLAFYAKVTLSGTWLKAGAKPYRATYHHVAGIKVYVDTAHGRVMIIAPVLR